MEESNESVARWRAGVVPDHTVLPLLHQMHARYRVLTGSSGGILDESKSECRIHMQCCTPSK